ncbi:hypothetical protein J7337_000747 [Fusarium musae]|uniref:Zn(2)-C6 fungal-type domain-containing protein n=1 Tax=Fusarium musae TaxID=1042133 RepID=A0A9P8DSG7_9HYPO|nr:hypothetical protein J7337_000747 [Fusarium musae]KAG9507198.1 hypothetical protein J7337_000747 [Fusarium musae]
MPNTGKPSKDCHLCRSRRVKCDLGRPSCQRCIKYGTECPGYRDEQELVFRNANPTTIKKRKKRTQQNATAQTRGESVMSFGSSSSSSSSNGDATTPSVTEEVDREFSPVSPTIVDLVEFTRTGRALILPQSLNEHWTAHSIPILLNVYYTLDFLHDTYKKSGPQGPLLWATHLFARTYITNLRYPTAIDNGSVEQTDKELGTYLGKTLSSVGQALKTPEGAMRDDVLATVWILTNYELLMGSIDRISPLNPWHLHTNGLYSILQQRGTASLRRPGSRMGFWPAYNMVQVRCLLTSLECPPESQEWFTAIRQTLHPGEGLAVEVGDYICKMAHVQKRMLDIIRARDFDTAALQYYDLIGIVFKAEDHFTTFDADYHYIDEVFNPYLRNMLNSARVKGYHVILTYANFLTHHPGAPIPLQELKVLRSHCVYRVRDSAKLVMEAVNRHLDLASFRNNPSPRTVFDALKLIWPLTAVYLVPSTLNEQSEAAGESLQFIGRELGVRQGLKVNKGESTLPPEAEAPSQLAEDAAFDPLPTSRGLM